MEDVFKFLLVIGIIAFGIVRQIKKETAKKVEGKKSASIPENSNPLPENWEGDTYGGYIPKGPVHQHVETVQVKESNSKRAKMASNRSNTSNTNRIISPPSSAPQVSAESEFAIHSLDEVRRGIIWSEILQRKY